MDRVRIAAVLALALPSVSAAQHERFGDPPMPPGPRLSGPAARPESPNGFASVQVNTDADGHDILLDAASEPSIAVDPRAPNRMAIGFRQFDTIESNFRQAGYAWTNDGGRSWNFPGVLEPGVFRSDPVLRADDEGVIYYNSLHTNLGNVWYCTIFRSLDGGQTWDNGVFAYGGDKAWMAIDRTGGIGHGNLYCAWNTAGNVYPGIFNRSTDGALNWSYPQKIPGSPIFGSMCVGPDGSIYVAGAGRVAKSSNAKDPGAEVVFDFSANTGLVTGGPGPSPNPNPAGLLAQHWVNADHSNGPYRGYIYALRSGGDVSFARSTDGGQTWSTPVKINDDPIDQPAWQWFGTMSVAPNGRIDVVWNDSRGFDVGNMARLFYSYSTDAGETWSPNEPLSPAWNTHLGWPQNNKIGDYYDMESDLVGANVAWAATFTGGQDIYYLRIGDYDCNGNGIGDTEDMASGGAQDCDADGIPDSCEIAAGAETDANGDGVPDSCQCYADFNFDGKADLFDFLNFMNQFDIENPRTDCDVNGAFNIFDFLCFINAFNEGC
jgi:hypothetical protein